MSDTISLVVILVITVFAYALLSRRLEGTMITPPIIFLTVGLLVSPLGLGFIDFESQKVFILTFAEIALVVTLLTDAGSVDTNVLRSNRLPVRLLLIGLPLTIALGAVIAALLFKDLALAEAGLIGAVLAPTDAGLGQAVIQNKRVPVRIRQAIDVESGLNDGGAVPFFALFLIIAQAEIENVPLDSWAVFAVQQIGLGLAIGAAFGLIGCWLMNKAIAKGWIDRKLHSIALLALALLTFLVSSSYGGSGFIAAYVAGLMIAATRKRIPVESIEYTGVYGEILGLGVFFIMGLALASVFPDLSMATIFYIVLYAILSLTVVRMLPVAVSLIGAHLDHRAVLFIGWFGPRGLASIVLMLIALEMAPDIPDIKIIAAVVFVTVLISVFAHGITAVPIINRFYGKGRDGPPITPQAK